MSCREQSRFILLGLTVLCLILSIVSSFYYGYGKLTTPFGIFMQIGLISALVLVYSVVLFCPNRIMWNAYRVLMSLCFMYNTAMFYPIRSPHYYDPLLFSFAIVLTTLLLVSSILSCIVRVPQEPVYKKFYHGKESPQITEELTDTSRSTVINPAFEPLGPIPTTEGFNMGPSVAMIVTDMPNRREIVEEDAQGNKFITTHVFATSGDEIEPNAGSGGAPHAHDYASGNAIAAPEVPLNTRKSSYQSEDEKPAMNNPYLGSQRSQGKRYPDLEAQSSSPSRNSSRRSSRSSSNDPRYLNHGIGQEEVNPNMDPELALALRASMQLEREDRNLDENPGATVRPNAGIINPSPVTERSASRRYPGDLTSPAFTESGKHSDAYTPDNSNNLDGSFTREASTLDGERKTPKKKKKKMRHDIQHQRSSSGQYEEQCL